MQRTADTSKVGASHQEAVHQDAARAGRVVDPNRVADSTGVAISVIVPLLNEAQQADRCCRGLVAALSGLSGNPSFQIVFIDDGSTDGTAEALLRAAHGDSRVDVIRIPRNVGQHQATLVGLRASVGEIVITFDADLDVRSEDIASILQPFAENQIGRAHV